MSSFLVGNEAISKIVHAIFWKFGTQTYEPFFCYWNKNNCISGKYIKTRDEKLLDETTAGKKLIKMNLDALSQRYSNENARTVNYKYETPIYYTDIQLLKTLKCYLYQCSEGHIENRKLYKDLRRAENILKDKIISELPEFDKAKWG